MTDQDRTQAGESRNSTEHSQLDKFCDLARKLRVNEDEAAFADAVRRVAGAPKPPEPERPDDV